MRYYLIKFLDDEVCMSEGRDGFDAAENALIRWHTQPRSYAIPGLENVWQRVDQDAI